MDVRLLTDGRYRAESWLAAHAPSGVIGTDPSYLPRLAPTRTVVRLKLAPIQPSRAHGAAVGAPL